LTRARQFRGPGAVLLLSPLALALAGCRHRTPPVAYQPPPAVAQPSGTREGTPARPAGPGSTNAQAVPRGRPLFTEVGIASWYGPPYHNRQAADGSIYDQNAMTAAHRELPMGSIVRVTNLANNQSVVVKITDRGPFVDGRIIDLSLAAAKAVGVYRAGTARVRVEAYAPPAGYDPVGKWCVQIGAFGDASAAVRLKNELMRRYGTAKVIEFAGPTGHWVRITPGNADRATADRIAQNMRIPDRGALPYLVRLN